MDAKNRVRWVEYKGNKILVADFSNLEITADAKEIVDESEKIHSTQPDGSVRRMTIMHNSLFNEEAGEMIAAYTSRILKYTLASATVGSSGLTNIILKIINPNIMNFDTEEEAMEWLIEQK